jgi:ribosome recycling factor
VIRLAFPPLTEERRKEFVKVVRHKAEEGKIAIRNLRRAGRHELDALQKDGDLSTDELDRVEKELDKITQDQVAAIDQLLTQKERDLLQV